MESKQCCLPVCEVFSSLRKRSTSAESSEPIYYECVDKTIDCASAPAAAVHLPNSLRARKQGNIEATKESGRFAWMRCFCCRRSASRSSSSSTHAPLQVVQSAQIMHTLKRPSRKTGIAVSPTLDELSDKKRQMVDDMRTWLEALPAAERPPCRHDLWLKRFLAHGKWNIEKAVQLYLEMENWRREIGADKILQADMSSNSVLPIDVAGFYPYGFDRTGRVICWMRVGHTPWWRPLFERTEEGVPGQLWASEHFQAQVDKKAEETGVWRERAVVIVDLSDLDFDYFQGLSFSSRARRRGTLLSVAQYYPGLVDKAYIVNAPGFASRAWSVLKQFLSKSLMEKAEMVSNSDERAAMLREIGAEHVPRELGGGSTSPSYPFPDYLRMPSDGWSAKLAAWRPKEITIGTNSQHVELISVCAGSRLKWQWALLDFSILFEVTGVITFPREEISFSGEEEPHCKEVDIRMDGEIRLIWDNSLSRLRSKNLLLRVEVV